MKTRFTALLIVLTLQGCSSSAPSQAEIETAVTTAFSRAKPQGCDKISVENIQKQNGMKVDESTYQIAATYEVRIAPVGHKDEIDALRTQKATLEGQRRGMEEKIEQVGKESGDPFANPTTYRMHPEETPEAVKPLMPQVAALEDQWGAVRDQLDQKVLSTKKEWGSDDCYLAVKNFGFNEPLDTIMAGGTNGFQLNFNMIKTDNGWMLAQ